MSLSHGAIRRPVFTSMVTLIVVLLGTVALMRLPIDLMPDITNPIISVSTEYENASPQIIEETVTRPIEEAMSAVPGVTEVSSTSSEGRSVVRVKFTWGTDLDAASSDVRDRLDRVLGRLPDDAERPVLFKFDTSAFPILMMSVGSHLDPLELRKIIENEIKFRVEQQAGVANLDIWGGMLREIRLELDPARIRALDISAEQVLTAILNANINKPAGFLDRGNYEITIRVPGEYESVREIENTVVGMVDGDPVFLRHVALVRDTYQQQRRIARIDGQPGLRIAVTKQSGTNTVDVARRVLREIDDINEDYAGRLRINVIVDTSEYIQNSIDNVSSSAVLGGGFAVVILLLFLRNLRSTFAIAVAIPVSIVATFALLYFGGLTLNIMTLGGLALGVGMLMDNAIVVIENITRIGEEERLGGDAAAEKGVSEVIMPIVASTLTTIAVFLPLVFIEGIAGVMFTQLALVVAFSLFASLMAAITLVPMLSAKLIKSHEPGERGLAARLFAWSERGLQALENDYRGLLHWVLNHRWVVVLCVVVLLGAAAAIVPNIHTELMPVTDEGEVNVTLELDVGSRIDLVEEITHAAEAIIRAEVPELVKMNGNIGASRWGGGGGNRANLRLDIGKRSERARTGGRSDREISAVLRRALAVLPGTTVRVREGSGLMGRMSGADQSGVSVEIRGHDFATADLMAARVRQILEDLPGAVDPKVSRDAAQRETEIRIDRTKAEMHGLTVMRISEFLETCLSGTQVGNFREDGKEYRILAKLRDAEKIDPHTLLDLTILNVAGVPVALKNVVDMIPSSGPTFIERRNQERVVTISANLDVGYALGTVMTAVDDVLRDPEQIQWPRGFTYTFTGDYEDQLETFHELAFAFALAIVLIYMVMACQYESLRDPLVVMFTVPLAGIGVVLTLAASGTTFNMQSFIGCIMLAGIVVNNAIILVDCINLLRQRDGMGVRAAIEEAGRRRLRPILMTSLTTILGVLPLAIGLGEGGEAQAPMARVVMGGLLSSMLITLVLIPVVYSFFETMKTTERRESGRFDAPKAPEVRLPT